MPKGLFFLPEENPCRRYVSCLGREEDALSLLHSLPETIAPEGVTYRFFSPFTTSDMLPSQCSSAFTKQSIGDHTTVLLQENPVQLVG